MNNVIVRDKYFTSNNRLELTARLFLAKRPQLKRSVMWTLKMGIAQTKCVQYNV